MTAANTSCIQIVYHMYTSGTSCIVKMPRSRPIAKCIFIFAYF